jgi:hypothetical protein
MARVLNLITFAISQQVVQSNIKPDGFTRWLSLFNPLLVDAKLAIIAICTTYNSYPFKLFQGKASKIYILTIEKNLSLSPLLFYYLPISFFC